MRCQKAFEKSRLSANESTKANRRVKRAYFNTVNSTLNNNCIPAKKKFSILLKLMKNQKNSSKPQLVENGITINDPIKKCDLFNDHFISKSTLPGGHDNAPDLLKIEGITPFQDINTSPFEVAHMIRSLKKSKTSACGIPGKLLVEIATPISYPLSQLFNNLFSIGHFPEMWKIAHVTAIYKKKWFKK